MEKPFIQEFEIRGLFGYKNICITFRHPILIVIGENGFGKTSILNALNFILTHTVISYQRLLEIKFDEIRVKIDGQDFSLEKSLIERYVRYKENNAKDGSHTLIDFIRSKCDEKVLSSAVELIENGEKKEFYGLVGNDRILRTFPANMVYQELFTWNEQNKAFANIRMMETLIENHGYEVVYYPTYRRVEVDYEHLFPNDDRRKNLRTHEVVGERRELSIRFGMDDVETRIENITDIIRKSSLEGFTNVSGEVIHQLLENREEPKRDLECTPQELKIVLNRTGNRLKEADKETIINQFENKDESLMNNDFLIFYLRQLLDIYRKQEIYDSAINKFCEVCNRYLREKEFVYDPSNVNLGIYRTVDSNSQASHDNAKKVELNQLSSGEKQIVSIFSQIYLEINKKYVILFDEPELSLSIYWQEQLLPDILKSGNCEFLVAVTHSPFIFGEDMQRYTVGMQEFLRK